MEQSKLYYPPGGILIWLLIILEIFTFLGAILVFLIYRGDNLEEFIASKNLMSPIIGTINTLVLVTSGFFMARAIEQLRKNNNAQALNNILFGLILGVGFLGIKGFEYSQKIDAGYGLDYNVYFTLYWLVTGFHFVHVLFGIGLLTYMYLAVKNKKYTSTRMDDVESSATYWHMCDLIWILIFPIFYLI